MEDVFIEDALEALYGAERALRGNQKKKVQEALAIVEDIAYELDI